jgi:Ca2+-binding RTX toxin-like protein
MGHNTKHTGDGHDGRGRKGDETDYPFYGRGHHDHDRSDIREYSRGHGDHREWFGQQHDDHWLSFRSHGNSQHGGIKGTPGDDVMTGTEHNDKLFGRDGNDQITGLAGDDRIKGGDGNDSLGGGQGNDFMSGGAGDDNMSDSEGSNVFFGGDGDDAIRSVSVTGVPVPQMVVHAGAGDDEIFGDSVEKVFIWGGDGNDSVTVRPTLTAVIYGGEGNDSIALPRGVPLLGSATIDAGPGDDFVLSSASPGSRHTVTLGLGKDAVFVGSAAENGLVITDFTPGVNGEVLNLSGERPAFSPLFGWLLGEHPPRPDPFDSGYLRLLQDGPDALLQLDGNGPQNGEAFITIVTLLNVDAQLITNDNFVYPLG